MLALDKIPDVIGFLVLTQDGAVLSSGGELENDEHRANIIHGLINITDKWVSFMQGLFFVDLLKLFCFESTFQDVCTLHTWFGYIYIPKIEPKSFLTEEV